jgi:hypothetical protein
LDSSRHNIAVCKQNGTRYIRHCTVFGADKRAYNISHHQSDAVTHNDTNTIANYVTVPVADGIPYNVTDCKPNVDTD